LKANAATVGVYDSAVIEPSRANPAPLVLVGAVALVTLGACGSEPQAPAPPAPYKIMITEPSGNIDASDEKLWAYWSCDPNVDPARHYTGAQKALWTDVMGDAGKAVLLVDASCPPAALLTVMVDANAVSAPQSQTMLRCQIFTSDGREVANESTTRDLGTSDPVCRVPIQ
jgi:hypothetical protein